MQKLVFVSFITATISFAVSESKLFRLLRERTKAKNSLLGKLLSCGYCLGHWVAIAMVVLLGIKLFDTWWLLDYLLTALAVGWLSGLQWAVMCWVMEKAGK
jgi:hypothetical protein